MYKKIFIKKKRVQNILKGHPWIFSKALEGPNIVEDGELCTIYCGQRFVGIGYYNKNKNIAVRILSRKNENINESFFIERFRKLKEKKEAAIKNTNAYRVVFGESDNLPGLIVDKYSDTLVVQFHTFGIERLKNLIAPALVKIYNPKCIYSKDNLMHGHKNKKSEVLFGDLKENIEINENGFKFLVNIVKGQKTGFFLDQRENRKSIQPYVKNKRILNCFSYTGGFSVYAAKLAKKVTSIDISKGAIEYAIKNFKLNDINPKKHEFITGDVFKYLQKIKTGQFDVIILDPPSFAHKKSQVQQAVKAYTTINSKALEKLPKNGILITSSCTAQIDEQTFIKILKKSAINADRFLKILYSSTQPFDHAYSSHFPEGKYLKFFIGLKD